MRPYALLAVQLRIPISKDLPVHESGPCVLLMPCGDAQSGSEREGKLDGQKD